MKKRNSLLFIDSTPEAVRERDAETYVSAHRFQGKTLSTTDTAQYLVVARFTLGRETCQDSSKFTTKRYMLDGEKLPTQNKYGEITIEIA